MPKNQHCSCFVEFVEDVEPIICVKYIYLKTYKYICNANIFLYLCDYNSLDMSNFVLYIRLEKYLHEWVTCHLGTPVVFPSRSNENAIIRTFMQKLPDGVTPEVNDGTMTAIAIPDSKAKPPAEGWTMMSERGKDAIREAIKDLFRRHLWNDINPLVNGNVGVNTLIAAWCDMNGIGIDRVETVRQCYYRMRDAYTKKGINLRNSSKVYSDDKP